MKLSLASLSVARNLGTESTPIVIPTSTEEWDPDVRDSSGVGTNLKLDTFYTPVVAGGNGIDAQTVTFEESATKFDGEEKVAISFAFQWQSGDGVLVGTALADQFQVSIESGFLHIYATWSDASSSEFIADMGGLSFDPDTVYHLSAQVYNKMCLADIRTVADDSPFYSGVLGAYTPGVTHSFSATESDNGFGIFNGSAILAYVYAINVLSGPVSDPMALTLEEWMSGEGGGRPQIYAPIYQWGFIIHDPPISLLGSLSDLTAITSVEFASIYTIGVGSPVFTEGEGLVITDLTLMIPISPARQDDSMTYTYTASFTDVVGLWVVNIGSYQGSEQFIVSSATSTDSVQFRLSGSNVMAPQITIYPCDINGSPIENPGEYTITAAFIDTEVSGLGAHSSTVVYPATVYDWGKEVLPSSGGSLDTTAMLMSSTELTVPAEWTMIIKFGEAFSRLRTIFSASSESGLLAVRIGIQLSSSTQEVFETISLVWRVGDYEIIGSWWRPSGSDNVYAITFADGQLVCASTTGGVISIHSDEGNHYPEDPLPSFDAQVLIGSANSTFSGAPGYGTRNVPKVLFYATPLSLIELNAKLQELVNE